MNNTVRSAGTPRRLRRRMPGLLAALTVACLTIEAASAVVPDEPLPDSAARLVNPEISTDGDYIIWLEADPTAPQGAANFDYYMWVDAVDPETGWPKHPGGRGMRFDNPDLRSVSIQSLPQWGKNDGTAHHAIDYPCPDWDGDFAVWVAIGPGRFSVRGGIARARIFTNPGTGDAQVCPEGAVILPESKTAPNQNTVLRLKRSFPYAAKNPESPQQLIAYQVRDRLADAPFGDFKVMAFDALDAGPLLAHELVMDEDLNYPFGNRAGAVVNFQAWLRGTSTLYLGAYLNCDPRTEYCPGEIARWQPGAGRQPMVVTSDGLPKVSAIPLLYDGLPALAAGIGNSQDSALYVTDPADPAELDLASGLYWDPAQSSLQGVDGQLEPFSAQSFEAFEWGGETYIVYQVSEDSLAEGDAGAAVAFYYQTEIWLARLPVGESPVVCKISMDDAPGLPRVRHEPEPVVLDGHAYVYYSFGLPGQRMLEKFQWLVRRIDLGDLSQKALFDAKCALGVAAAPPA